MSGRGKVVPLHFQTQESLRTKNTDFKGTVMIHHVWMDSCGFGIELAPQYLGKSARRDRINPCTALLLPQGSSASQTHSSCSPAVVWPEEQPTPLAFPSSQMPCSLPPDTPGNPGNGHHRNTDGQIRGSQQSQICGGKGGEKKGEKSTFRLDHHCG